MESAKAAVSNFMSKAGHHDTTVHEGVAPAVTHETIIPQKHEKVTTAVDREVHQDHHHTTIQPIKDQQVLPEQHHHNAVAVEHREFHHGKDDQTKARLAETAAQFKDKHHVAATQETRSVAPVVGGEHIHHHVHETIQPVIQRETIQPQVVHTTVPVHEVHHREPQHHEVTALPAVSLHEFKNSGGSLTGREERYDGFEGEPRNIGGNHGHHTGAAAGGAALAGGAAAHHHHDKHSGHSHTGTAATGAGLAGAEAAHHHNKHNTTGTGVTGTGVGSHNTTSGPHNSNIENKFDPRVDSDRDGSKTVGNHNTTGYNDSTTTAPKKTGLLAKLDPRVDSNGDGKAGFMK